MNVELKENTSYLISDNNQAHTNVKKLWNRIMNELKCPKCDHTFFVDDFDSGDCPNCGDAHYYWKLIFLYHKKLISLYHD